MQEVRERVWVPRFLHTLGFLPTDGGALILTDDGEGRGLVVKRRLSCEVFKPRLRGLLQFGLET